MVANGMVLIYTEQGTMLQHFNNVRQAAVNWTGDKATANGMNGNKGATAVNTRSVRRTHTPRQLFL